MSSACGEPRERADGSEGAQVVPTQRRVTCPCGHPDVANDHVRGTRDGGACHNGSRLAAQLVIALRRGC